MKIWSVICKRCTTCGVTKDLHEFYFQKDGPAQRTTNCKTCKNIASSKWCKNNKEVRARISAKYRANNLEKAQAAVNRWQRNNRPIVNAIKRKRYAKEMNSIPSWVDWDLVKDMYLEAEYHQLTVDHIVPLVSKTVCGLHWEGNLQLLSFSENASKGNRIWPEM